MKKFGFEQNGQAHVVKKTGGDSGVTLVSRALQCNVNVNLHWEAHVQLEFIVKKNIKAHTSVKSQCWKSNWPWSVSQTLPCWVLGVGNGAWTFLEQSLIYLKVWEEPWPTCCVLWVRGGQQSHLGGMWPQSESTLDLITPISFLMIFVAHVDHTSASLSSRWPWSKIAAADTVNLTSENTFKETSQQIHSSSAIYPIWDDMSFESFL